jgi:rfaE bifunctional protein nucleotidyltransferase chain/domain
LREASAAVVVDTKAKVAVAVEAALRESAAAAADLPRLSAQAASAAQLIVLALTGGGKVLCFGNGGSASDAQHLSSELVGRFRRDRGALPAIALTVDGSALTSIANDSGFEHVFSRQLEGYAKPGDVAVAITTSGRSANVLAGIETARRMKLAVIVLTGPRGAVLNDRASIVLVSAADDTARIQECHGAVIHAICDAVEEAMVGVDLPRTPRGVVTTLPDLAELREYHRRCGRVVVWTNGVFDLLHVGHLNTLRAAREFGDVLFVGVNDDASVRRLKGPRRPLTPARERAQLVAALDPVDRVVVFTEDTPDNCLRVLEPDVHVKGDDYRPPDGKPMPEAATVAAYGGRIEFVARVPDRSTSLLVDALGQ